MFGHLGRLMMSVFAIGLFFLMAGCFSFSNVENTHTVYVGSSVSSTAMKSETMHPLLLAGSYQINSEWEKIVSVWESQNAPINGTVFLGSSSFAMWTTLEQDMAEFKAINRGFGGSTTSDALYYAQRILNPLKPNRIVYYEGTNDIAMGKDPEMAIANFMAFVDIARSINPQVEIYFVFAHTAPVRSQFAKEYERLNNAAQALSRVMPGVYALDANKGLTDNKGRPREDLYLSDRLHLNEQGYKIWKQNIRRGLQNKPVKGGTMA